MKSAAFWSASDDGSSWYRCDQPSQAISWLGHESVVTTNLSPMFRHVDTIVGSRVALPGPSEIWRMMAAAPDGPRLVLDLDDDYFHIDPTNEKAYEFWNRPELQANLVHNAIVADRITVASEGLAEVVAEKIWNVSRDLLPNIRVVPNGLHAAYLGTPRNYSPETITIGWAGSTATSIDYRDSPVPRALALALRTYPHVRVRMVGMPEELHLKHERVEVARWVTPNEAYLSAVSSFDIWVAPYRDTPFNQAKFPTKALEAGMLGIPLIASAIRPYQDWINPGRTGLLVDSPHEWTRCLKYLIEDASHRQRIGEASRSESVHNILQEVGKTWETALFS